MIALQTEFRKAQRGEKVYDTIHKNVNELLLFHNKKHEDSVGFLLDHLAKKYRTCYTQTNHSI